MAWGYYIPKIVNLCWLQWEAILVYPQIDKGDSGEICKGSVEKGMLTRIQRDLFRKSTLAGG